MLNSVNNNNNKISITSYKNTALKYSAMHLIMTGQNKITAKTRQLSKTKLKAPVPLWS